MLINNMENDMTQRTDMTVGEVIAALTKYRMDAPLQVYCENERGQGCDMYAIKCVGSFEPGDNEFDVLPTITVEIHDV